MARPCKDKIDWIKYDVGARNGRTLKILRHKFQNDGYAVWFITLEILAEQKGLFFDFSDPVDWAFYQAEVGVDEGKLIGILDLLATLKAIDPECYAQKIIWVQNLAERFSSLWDKRKNDAPKNPLKIISDAETPVIDAETPVCDAESTQSRVEKSRVEKSRAEKSNIVGQARFDLGDEGLEIIEAEKVDETDLIAGEVIDRLNALTGAKFKADNKETRKNIGARVRDGHTLGELLEVVEKKNAEWRGTDMEKYLRPSTLFRPSHFEEYLAQPWPRERGPTAKKDNATRIIETIRREEARENEKIRDSEVGALPAGDIRDPEGIQR